MNDEKKDAVLASTEISYEQEPAPSYTEEEYNNTQDDGPEPTAEEWKELPEVSDTIPAAAFLVILVEFCERFTYYGLSGPFQNYIQNPAPPSCKLLIVYTYCSSLTILCTIIRPC